MTHSEFNILSSGDLLKNRTTSAFLSVKLSVNLFFYRGILKLIKYSFVTIYELQYASFIIEIEESTTSIIMILSG